MDKLPKMNTNPDPKMDTRFPYSRGPNESASVMKRAPVDMDETRFDLRRKGVRM